jgi:hypothetical protein
MSLKKILADLTPEEWTEITAQMPDDVLRSAWASRNSRRRQNCVGGKVWGKHSETNRCRCKACNAKRDAVYFQATDMYKNGDSVASVARELKIPYMQLWKEFHKRGIVKK